MGPKALSRATSQVGQGGSPTQVVSGFSWLGSTMLPTSSGTEQVWG